jgi:hypothetical protein
MFLEHYYKVLKPMRSGLHPGGKPTLYGNSKDLWHGERGNRRRMMRVSCGKPSKTVP